MTREHCDLCDAVITESKPFRTTDYSVDLDTKRHVVVCTVCTARPIADLMNLMRVRFVLAQANPESAGAPALRGVLVSDFESFKNYFNAIAHKR